MLQITESNVRTMPSVTTTHEDPLRFHPRPYQVPLLNYLISGGRRAIIVWHRRAGKDLTLFNAIIRAAWFDRVGTYYYFYPTYAQGKKALWDGMDHSGRPNLSYIPESMIAPNGKNETELQIKLKNGSIIQIIGTDRYDSVRSTNPVGCVFNEYQDQDPEAFNVVEPILKANKGWAAFAYTPRGRNHAWDLFAFAQKEPNWFTQLLTVDETRDEQGDRIVSPADIDELRRRGLDEEFIQQEYYCSFNGVQVGSYYGRLMNAAKTENRIGVVPYNPRYPVVTAHDLGHDDINAIWFAQILPNRVNMIHYYENRNEGLDHYASYIRQHFGNYAYHVLPKDINVTEYTTNQKRIDAAYAMGLKPIRVAPNISIQEGIDAVRRLLPICYFDEENCRRGIHALEDYHKKRSEQDKTFSLTPHHTWSSNAADAFRYLAVTMNADEYESDQPLIKQAYADHDFNIFSHAIGV